MGKGRILSGGTDGLYQIEILEDRTRAEAARTTAVQRVAQLDARITDLEADLAAAQGEVDAAAAAQDQAIADYQAALTDDGIDTAEAREAMVKAGEALVEAASARDAVRGHIRAAKAERLSLQARIDRIDALPPLRQVSAWCADYTEDLGGEVATAEVPGEVGQVIIQPGFTDGAAWSPSEDGAIQPALSGTPASVFYNLAMMPGWQRWRPTFRIATISNIDNDLCDIALDAATSSQQGLDVNAQGSYSGVPIMYMDCNGNAFEDGDRVLVAFSGNTEQPMVVGFEQKPKACNVIGGIFFDMQGDLVSNPSGGSSGDTWCSTGGLSLSETPFKIASTSLKASTSVRIYRTHDQDSIGSLDDLTYLSSFESFELGYVSSQIFLWSETPEAIESLTLCFIGTDDEIREFPKVPVLNRTVADAGLSFLANINTFYKNNYSNEYAVDPFTFSYSTVQDNITLSVFHGLSSGSFVGDGSWYSTVLDAQVGQESYEAEMGVSLDDLPALEHNGVVYRPKTFIKAFYQEKSEMEEAGSAVYVYRDKIVLLVEYEA